jgi:hypothetical protein
MKKTHKDLMWLVAAILFAFAFAQCAQRCHWSGIGYDTRP